MLFLSEMFQSQRQSVRSVASEQSPIAEAVNCTQSITGFGVIKVYLFVKERKFMQVEASILKTFYLMPHMGQRQKTNLNFSFFSDGYLNLRRKGYSRRFQKERYPHSPLLW